MVPKLLEIIGCRADFLLICCSLGREGSGSFTEHPASDCSAPDLPESSEQTKGHSKNVLPDCRERTVDTWGGGG